MNIQQIKHDKDFVLCTLDLDSLNSPMFQKMWALSLLRKTFAGQGFKFDDKTEHYWQQNESAWDEHLHSLNLAFSRFAHLILDQAIGSLYVDINRLNNIIESVYRYEKAFEQTTPSSLPSIVYKTLSSINGMELKILNLNDFQDLSPSLKLDFPAYVLNMLKFQHAQRNNVDFHSINLTLHSSLKDFSYPLDNVNIQHSVRFSGKDYCLTGFIYHGLMQLSNPDKILRMLISIDDALTYYEKNIS